jgi:hypothetical protein
MSILSLLLVVDMVVDRCGRWPPILDVRGTDEGCRLELSRTGKLVLLSVGLAIVSSATEGGGTSPRLETRLSSERVIVDLERLCWFPLLLLLVGGESAVDWMEAYEDCLCRCGLGERRDAMGKCNCGASRCQQKRGGDRMMTRRDTLSQSHRALLPLLFPRSLILYKAEEACAWGALLPGYRAVATYLSSCEDIGGSIEYIRSVCINPAVEFYLAINSRDLQGDVAE